MNSHYHHRAWLAGLALLVGGCAQPSHLVLQQKTSLGIDVSTDTTTARIHVDTGYNRETNTFVPKTKVKRIDGEKEHEAMSVISLNEIKVKFFGTHEVNEQFATGDAAQLLAKSPASLAQLTTLSETSFPSTTPPAAH